MSTTRNDARSAKRLKAITTGADYGVKAAGATSVGLNALGLCITISNPILLGIASAVGAVFCCLGCCYEWRQPAEEDKLAAIERKEDSLVEMERKMEAKIDSLSHQRDRKHRHVNGHARRSSRTSLHEVHQASQDHRLCGGVSGFSIFSHKDMQQEDIAILASNQVNDHKRRPPSYQSME